MWLLFGALAIILACLNIASTFQNKSSKWYRFFSLALTALTICAFYSESATRAMNEDWSGICDIMPTMSKALWVCVFSSIFINSISLFKGKD